MQVKLRASPLRRQTKIDRGALYRWLAEADERGMPESPIRTTSSETACRIRCREATDDGAKRNGKIFFVKLMQSLY